MNPDVWCGRYKTILAKLHVMSINTRILSLLCLMTCLICLSGCGSDPETTYTLSPEPPAYQDPTDGVLKTAIAGVLAARGAPAHSQYDFIRVDLNSDGLRDALVLFRLPHTFWCGWSGCQMTIFRAGAGGFTAIGDMTNVRGPLVVADTQTNGWRDIVLEISGTNLANRLALMGSNGASYPANPLNQPAAPYGMLRDVPGARVFQ